MLLTSITIVFVGIIFIIALIRQTRSRSIQSLIGCGCSRSFSLFLPVCDADTQYSILVLLQLNMTLAEAFAKGFDNVVELSDQLALDDHFLTRHLKFEILVDHLGDIVSNKLVHLGLSHEFVDNVEDDGSLFEAELFKDAVV